MMTLSAKVEWFASTFADLQIKVGKGMAVFLNSCRLNDYRLKSPGSSQMLKQNLKEHFIFLIFLKA